VVYGPTSDSEKPTFLDELISQFRLVHSGPWLVTSNFNMIYQGADKNNDRLNRRLVGQFHHFLNDSVPKEIHLSGRLYTWSNERSHPTLERIDRAFMSMHWDEIFLNYDLQALSSSCLDHAPLLLRTDPDHQFKKRFTFRSFWTRCDGFLEVVQRAWHYPLWNATPFARLDWLFRNTARFLKSWSDRFLGNVRLQLALANEVVSRLEAARGRRALAMHEECLCKELKLKALELSSLQRTIARQESCVAWIREGDAPTRFFHAHANARRRHNFIRSFVPDGCVVIDEEAKAEVALDFFENILATPPTRARRIKLDQLDLSHVDMTGMCSRLVWAVIRALPPDKAPGLDGFSARFLQAAWPVIRHDLMMAFDSFWHLDARNLHSVNEALLTLLPKSAEALTVKDYIYLVDPHCG
jgi:hypothetical protein